ncbi:MAG: hypothetical protein PHO65_03355 [Sulfurovum sp.]|nr:hypothetical protein [Sulfurovum sp.]
MKLAVIGAGKWGPCLTGRIRSKAPYTALTLGQLQQLAHATSCILFKVLEKGYKI